MVAGKEATTQKSSSVACLTGESERENRPVASFHAAWRKNSLFMVEGMVATALHFQMGRRRAKLIKINLII